jgi:hypothetical protein
LLLDSGVSLRQASATIAGDDPAKLVSSRIAQRRSRSRFLASAGQTRMRRNNESAAAIGVERG